MLTVQDLELEHGNSVQNPSGHDVRYDEPVPLGHRARRDPSTTDRKLQDVCSSDKHRADSVFIVHELCQRMSNVTFQSLAKLKWPVTYF